MRRLRALLWIAGKIFSLPSPADVIRRPSSQRQAADAAASRRRPEHPVPALRPRTTGKETVLALSFLAAAALTGCAVGPDYRQPATVPHAEGGFVSTPTAGAAAAEPPGDWWRLYNDPVLDDLIVKAFAANTDLRVAEANLQRARAVLSEARVGLFPTTELTGGATYGRSAGANSAAAAAGTRAQAQWAYQAGFDMNYQVDLFGRVRRTIEAAKADAQSVEAARDVVRITVVSEVARAYVDGCAYAAELAVANRNLALAQSDLDLVTLQRNAGALSDLEPARAETVLEQARAAIPTLEGARQANLFALAALLGLAPKDAPQSAAACTAAPRLADPIPVGDGASLLARRPDVREAERTLAADTARIGIATADLYPSVTLGGSINAAGSQHTSAFAFNSVSYGIGPLISWSFPNILEARARIREAKAATQAALASFDGTMLTALKEAEQALTTYGAELNRNAALVRARDASRRAYDLVQLRYRTGSISQLDLITAEQTLIQAEQALAQSNQLVAEDQVTVFKALGGGWRR
jgi:NodT family efflux transporter outer membrane factor (OMF) lipoprotein